MMSLILQKNVSFNPKIESKLSEELTMNLLSQKLQKSSK